MCRRRPKGVESEDSCVRRVFSAGRRADGKTEVVMCSVCFRGVTKVTGRN